MSITNLGRIIRASCAAHGSAEALVGSGVSLVYRELGERADALAGSLADEGVEANEPVAAMVSNHPLDLVAFVGIWLAGGVVVPIHRTTPEALVAQTLAAPGSRLIVDPLGGRVSLADWARSGALIVSKRPPPPARPVLTDGALVIFTSGSTGKPKGAVLSHRAFGGKLDAIDSLLHFGAGERTLLVLNLTFSFANWVSLLTLKTGGTLVMHEKFAPLAFCEALASEQITRVGVVPTMMRALFAALGDAPIGSAIGRVTTAGALRQILIGGESLGRALAGELMRRFPAARLIDIYGLTETSTSDFFLFPEDHPTYSGCIGRPSPGIRFRIASPDGAEMPQGEIGELQIRTPFAMNGYLDAPDLTAAAFHDDWFRTGDLARVRDGGVVELAGRAKEIISRGGNKVSPLEIEQVFAAHPDVAAAMAAGVPDPILGERIHLLVVPRPGCAPTEPALRQFAAPNLPKFKQPDVFHFAADLPLGRTGKADRGRLRQMIEGGELSA